MVLLVLSDILPTIVILKYLNLVELTSLPFTGRDKAMIALPSYASTQNTFMYPEINRLIDSQSDWPNVTRPGQIVLVDSVSWEKITLFSE